jgi:hypothetical protein
VLSRVLLFNLRTFFFFVVLPVLLLVLLFVSYNFVPCMFSCFVSKIADAPI